MEKLGWIMRRKYKNLIWRLKLTKEPLGVEAADAIKELIEENERLHEGYEAMFHELQREHDCKND